jgi:aminoglycoside phosphotransferase
MFDAPIGTLVSLGRLAAARWRPRPHFYPSLNQAAIREAVGTCRSRRCFSPGAAGVCGDVEVEAMAMAPIPTPEVLWRKPPVLALAALPGAALGRLGEPSTASPAAWAAAGAAARMLHDAPLPPWPGRSLEEIASELDGECEWLITNDVLPADLVTRNRRIAEAALRPWTPVFTHGDLQITHVFADGNEITGVIDWSGAGQGDALYDLAILTLGHEEHLSDVVAGYGPTPTST